MSKKEKSVLVVRHGAYGDMIHMSHLPRLFKGNGFSFVGVSTGKKGSQIFAHNPFIDKLHFMEFGGSRIPKKSC